MNGQGQHRPVLDLVRFFAPPLVMLEHDPEKWEPVFGKDHAPPVSWSGMTIRRKVIPLQGPTAVLPPGTQRPVVLTVQPARKHDEKSHGR
jgi:hypothetical protein